MYFSGFCLENEKELFKEYLIENYVTVSAFSYGCISLVENIVNGTYSSNHYKKRIDTIQLFSPAYLNDKDDKYKRMQLIYFGKDSNSYTDNFLINCGLKKEDKKSILKWVQVKS